MHLAACLRAGFSTIGKSRLKCGCSQNWPPYEPTQTVSPMQGTSPNRVDGVAADRGVPGENRELLNLALDDENLNRRDRVPDESAEFPYDRERRRSIFDSHKSSRFKKCVGVEHHSHDRYQSSSSCSDIMSKSFAIQILPLSIPGTRFSASARESAQAVRLGCPLLHSRFPRLRFLAQAASKGVFAS